MQFLRYSRGNALLPVSYYLSRAMRPETFSHNEHSPSLDKQDTGVHLFLLCLTLGLFVKICTVPASMYDSHHDRWLAPAALA